MNERVRNRRTAEPDGGRRSLIKRATNRYQKPQAFWRLLAPLLVFAGFMLFWYGWTEGGRFSPQAAVDVHPSLGEQAQLLGEFSVRGRRVYLYDNGDFYHTMLVSYRFPFWRCDGRTTYAYKNDDTVQLLGWCAESNEDNVMTVVPLRSYDPAVDSFVMGQDRQKVKSIPGEVVFFYWNREVRWGELDALALDAQGTTLYRLDYEDHGEGTITSDIHWVAGN